MSHGTVAPTHLIYGYTALENTVAKLMVHRTRFAPFKITIMLFDQEESISQVKRVAARISAQQKKRAFESIGLTVDTINVIAEQESQFNGLIERLNEESNNLATLIQHPIPARLKTAVQKLHASKDIDDELGKSRLFSGCATAEAVVRLLQTSFAEKMLTVVLGAKGFVGSSITHRLRNLSWNMIEIDIGDDLGATQDADIVVSAIGSPNILGRQHVFKHHNLVVDIGFNPILGYPQCAVGDVSREVYNIPRSITPVPGGMGPLQMAVLLERADIMLEARPTPQNS